MIEGYVFPCIDSGIDPEGYLNYHWKGKRRFVQITKQRVVYKVLHKGVIFSFNEDMEQSLLVRSTRSQRRTMIWCNTSGKEYFPSAFAASVGITHA